MAFTSTILHDEKELFIQLSQDDQAAFTKIFDHYEPRLYAFVLKMTRSATSAEEIVQELFIKLWTNRSSVASIQNPRSYIFRMATNRTANYLKSLARNSRVEKKASDIANNSINSTDEIMDLKEMTEQVHKLLGQLPEQQKKVYLMSRKDGLKTEEIATRLNLSEKTVKNHLTAALRFIRERLRQSPGTTTSLLLLVAAIAAKSNFNAH